MLLCIHPIHHTTKGVLKSNLAGKISATKSKLTGSIVENRNFLPNSAFLTSLIRALIFRRLSVSVKAVSLS